MSDYGTWNTPLRQKVLPMSCTVLCLTRDRKKAIALCRASCTQLQLTRIIKDMSWIHVKLEKICSAMRWHGFILAHTIWIRHSGWQCSVWNMEHTIATERLFPESCRQYCIGLERDSLGTLQSILAHNSSWQRSTMRCHGFMWNRRI